MNVVVLDFETFSSNEFTLSALTTEAYCRDPRFEAHGCAIKASPDDPTVWYERGQLPYVFSQIDWSHTFCVCHHFQFDGLILSHHYGVRPKMAGCTLSMARLLLGNHLSVSLDAVRQHFGMPLKKTPYNLFKGKRWHELTPAVQELVGQGAADEVETIWRIFQILLKDFPQEELEVIDATMKMFTQPTLKADVNLLADVWEEENRRKQQATEALGIDPSELRSAAKFQALLEAEGVEIVYKDGKNGPIPAFSKTDEFMRELLEDDDPRVRALVEARLGAKSTLLQTRAQTLGEMANRGPMCVYLRYAGAHTTRWSGGDGCLTADTIVVVSDPQKGVVEKRIVDVLLDDLVWDGEEFVTHDGVVFRGYQEVIEHDGIKGTSDHKVFTEKGEATLGEAREHGLALQACPCPKHLLAN